MFVVFFMIQNTLFFTSLTRAVNLERSFRLQMDEYYNLLNRVREGVIILSKDCKLIEFYNKSVKKLFAANKSQHEKLQITHLDHQMFCHTDL